MSYNYTCCIDEERLNGSIETLSCIDNCLNNKDLSNDFIEIEEVIKNTNFNHNNCISNYKDKINYIEEELQNIKNDINSLTNSLSKTVTEFANASEFKSKDLEDIFGYFNSDTDINNLAINNNLQVANSTSSFKENINVLRNSMNLKDTNLIRETGANIADVNTVPVGLGIGAAGITAAVGTVYVDSLNKNNKESFDKIEDYENDEYKDLETEDKKEEIKLDYDNLKKVEHDRMISKEEKEEVTPYFANRDKTKIDKFYDDEN